MSVCLKKYPNAIQDWLSANHAHLKNVHVAKSPIDQSTLNPYECRIIIVYRETEDRIHLQGWFEYGEEFLNSMNTLEYYKQNYEDEVVFDDRIVELSVDLVKKHVDGEFFSLETFEVLLSFGRIIRSESNSLVPYLKRFAEFLDLMDEPTLMDLQRYYKKFPKSECPQLWFRVPMEEIICNDLPLYQGGYFHVSGREMDNWILRHLLKNLKKFPKEYDVRPPPPPAPLRKKVKHIDVNEQLAPCIDIKDHFPKDRERQNMVRVLARAEVPLEFVRDKLENLNNRFPSKGVTLKRRWDYEKHYKAGYTPFRCDQIDCPLNPGESLEVKRRTCSEMFKQKFGTDLNKFYGPFSWFDW